jgi:gamma-glutamylcyclotransferase (GGCT)/AIG2-like uncharacterized protein YtfP
MPVHVVTVLRSVNAARATGAADDVGERAAESAFGCSGKLAVYGSLAPGRVNHRIVAHLGGTWRDGLVRGHLHESGWGAGMAYPGFVWDSEGPLVAIRLLESERLAGAWPGIDAFEGPDYLRILVPVELGGGEGAVANLYAVRVPGDRRAPGVPRAQRRS